MWRKPLRFPGNHDPNSRSIAVLRALAKGNHSASRRRENGGAHEINSTQEDECSPGNGFPPPAPLLTEWLRYLCEASIWRSGGGGDQS